MASNIWWGSELSLRHPKYRLAIFAPLLAEIGLEGRESAVEFREIQVEAEYERDKDVIKI